MQLFDRSLLNFLILLLMVCVYRSLFFKSIYPLTHRSISRSLPSALCWSIGATSTWRRWVGGCGVETNMQPAHIGKKQEVGQQRILYSVHPHSAYAFYSQEWIPNSYIFFRPPGNSICGVLRGLWKFEQWNEGRTIPVCTTWSQGSHATSQEEVKLYGFEFCIGLCVSMPTT